MCNEAARRTALGLMREDFSQLKIPLRFPEGLPNLGEAPSIRITDTTAIVRAAWAGAGATGGLGDSPTPGPSPEGEGSSGVGPSPDEGGFELVMRRWSWVGPGSAARAGKPVYNFRSEGRRFDNAGAGERGSGRCLIPLDGFYEFTDPGTVADVAGADAVAAGALTLPLQGQWASPSPLKGEGKRKAKWLFTLSPGAGAAWDPAGRAAPGLFAVAGLWRAGVDLGRGATGEAFTMLTCAPGPDIAPFHARQIVLMPRDRWADWLGGVVPAADLIAPTPAGTLTATLAVMRAA